MSNFFYTEYHRFGTIIYKNQFNFMTSTLANGLIADELYLNPALKQVGLYLKDFAIPCPLKKYPNLSHRYRA